MLREFVLSHRDEIVARCRSKISTRPVPRPTETALEFGVPLFLDELAHLLAATDGGPTIVESATPHGGELLAHGFTVGQVVHDYGGICQAITELAIEERAPISTGGFQILNRSLDEAIAESVTEYSRLRDYQGTERLGHLAHELRNLVNTALLAFQALRGGSVGVGGSTGAVLGRSLGQLRDLVDHELTAVRLSAGVRNEEAINVARFIEDVETAASLDGDARGLVLTVDAVDHALTVMADRQLLGSAVSNLLQNAFKFTPRGGRVVLHAHSRGARVLIDVEDQCGGLAPGKVKELFRPFAQRNGDKSGLGLGLAIARRAVEVSGGELRVVSRAGEGCMFTVDLPRRT